MVKRSSNSSVTCSPMRILRSRLWASTRVRNATRSRAYGSRGSRSVWVSGFKVAKLLFPSTRGEAGGAQRRVRVRAAQQLQSMDIRTHPIPFPTGEGLDAVGLAQQRQRMLLPGLLVQTMREMRAGHRAVAGERRRARVPDARFDRLRDLAGQRIGLRFDPVGAVVTRATLDRDDFGVGHQRKDVASLWPDLLHALMAGHVPGELAQRLLEVGLQQSRRMTFGQIFERVEEGALHQLDVFVVRKHQGQ